MRRWTALAPLLLLTLVGLTLSACRQETRTLVVGTSADWKPFEYIDEDGSYAGFDISLMEEIGRRLNLEIEWREIAFDSLLESLAGGEIEAVIAAMSPTPERQMEVDFTEPYYVSVDAFLVAPGSGITLSGEEDLTGYRIGVLSDTVQAGWVDETIGGVIERYDNAEQAVAALAAGQVDVVVMNYYPALTFTGEGGVELGLRGEFSEDAVAIAVRKGDRTLRDQLSRTITELQDEGFIEELAIEFMSGE